MMRVVAFAGLGLVFGSFLTVVIHRVPRKESIVLPGSACPECGVHIRARDNIPVISYLLLRGRCRSCGTRISPEYPITEALTAALFVAAGAAFRQVSVAAVVAPFLGVMLACALIDARFRIIPHRIVFPSLALFGAALIGVAVLTHEVSVLTGALGLLAYGGPLFLLAVLVEGAMGGGDVWLAALIGLVLGALGLRYVLVAAMVAVLLGGLGSVVALARGASRKDTIPFGPYMAGAAVVAALFAPGIAGWYAGLAH